MPDEVHLLVDLAGQRHIGRNAGAVVHHRRRAGLALGAIGRHVLPHAGIDLRVAALVGMAAMFAGASRALLASVVFAFETTLQPLGLLPLLGGCAASFLVSALLMRNTIMTEKIARRGVRVPAEYAADFLDQVLVRDVASPNVVTLRSSQTLREVQAWIAARGAGHRSPGLPGRGRERHRRRRGHAPASAGSRRPRRATPSGPDPAAPVVVYADSTLRDAADHMVNHDIGRLPVIERGKPGKVVGFITRSDLLSAHRRRLGEARSAAQPAIALSRKRTGTGRPAAPEAAAASHAAGMGPAVSAQSE